MIYISPVDFIYGTLFSQGELGNGNLDLIYMHGLSGIKGA